MSPRGSNPSTAGAGFALASLIPEAFMLKRRAPLALAVAALLLFSACAPASAGILDRARKIGAAFGGDTAVVLGTALTPPIRVAPNSDETEVWVFSTTLGHTLERVRFAATDLARVVREVDAGATIVVLAAAPARTDGAILASRWRSVIEGNPLRADFLRANRHRILVFALRNDPATLQHIYAGNMGELRQVAQDLAKAQDALLRLGIAADGNVRNDRIEAGDIDLPPHP
jgi:hypothetical protein